MYEICTKCVRNVYEMCTKCVRNVYEMCTKCLSSIKGSSKKFIDGLNNLKSSKIKEHEKGEPHKSSKRYREQDEAKERGETYRVDIPTDAPIAQSFKRMR